MSIFAEKGEGDVSFQSVFVAKVTKSTGPKLPGGKDITEPKFDKGQEYLKAVAKGERGIPKFSRRALLAEQIPEPGDPPKQSIEGHFLLVNLKPDEGRVASDEAPTAGGLLALWWKCPHLGCTIPWKESFVSPFDDLKRRGMFNCNCHGSTYTKAGALVKGPATRAMDTMAIEVTKSGIIVQTGSIRKGDNDNPRRAIPYSGRVETRTL